VVAVIPNWNGVHLLDTVLEGLARQTFAELATVVVDNGSTDGSVEHLVASWPEVGVVSHTANLGFAAAVNSGVGASDGEFVLLLNNDVEPDPEFVAELVGGLEARPSAGSAASKMLDAGCPEVIDGAGDVVGWDGYCARRGRGERDKGQYDAPCLVFSACAGAALYRRSALESVGLFDESFFAYIEDVDWGFRAQLAGYDCLYVPAAIARHRGAATSGQIEGFELFQCHRNMLAMVVKDFPREALWRYAPWAIARRIGSIVKATARGQGRIVLRAWASALRRLPATLGERRRVQARRVRGYADLRELVPARAPVPRRGS